jgi:HK97 family phage prohead protease
MLSIADVLCCINVEHNGGGEMELLNVPFEMKAESLDESGYFEGYGSTFGGPPDAGGDVVMEGAFSKTLKKGGRNGTGVAMLWQHDFHAPLGVWKELAEDKNGLKTVGQLAVDTQLGHDARILMKMGALQGLSMGYDATLKEIDDKKKIRYLKEVELWEISPVTFPMNTRATITSVKEMREAQTPRELERALRDAGLTKSEAQYVVSLCRGSLREATNPDEIVIDPLTALHMDLKKWNAELAGINIARQIFY